MKPMGLIVLVYVSHRNRDSRMWRRRVALDLPLRPKDWAKNHGDTALMDRPRGMTSTVCREDHNG